MGISEDIEAPMKLTIVSDRQSVASFYERGYLPAFLPQSKDQRLFYCAPQSVRVDLSKFALSSENRRVLSKTTQFSYEIVKTEDFVYDPIRVGKFCKDYFDTKFGKGVMSVSRIKRIFSAPMTSHVWLYRRDQDISPLERGEKQEGGVGVAQDQTPSPNRSGVSTGHPSADRPLFRERDKDRVGYVTCFINDELFNYTFVFYDLKYYKENLGMRMMLDSVMWAKEQRKKYIYLGSVRDLSGLYKTQFNGWEFWDGKGWSSDKEDLKRIVFV